MLPYPHVSTAQYEAMIKLSEGLKALPDDVLGAEEKVVQLTERNLMLSEVRETERAHA